MLAQRLRRWSNIVHMLYKCFVFAGLVEAHKLREYTDTDMDCPWIVGVPGRPTGSIHINSAADCRSQPRISITLRVTLQAPSRDFQ